MITQPLAQQVHDGTLEIVTILSGVRKICPSRSRYEIRQCGSPNQAAFQCACVQENRWSNNHISSPFLMGVNNS